MTTTFNGEGQATKAPEGSEPSTGARHKVYKEGPDGLRAPFQAVAVEEGASVVWLYDTSGPEVTDTSKGLPGLRSPWVESRGDTFRSTR